MNTGLIPESFRIQTVHPELSDTFTLELVPLEGNRELHFLPGQFNMLYAFGQGEVPISISGDPTRTGSLVHTIRAVGPVTRAMWRMRAGEVMGLRGPFGTAWPVREMEGSDVVIVAGGVGLAPLRPAIYWVLAHRKRYGRVCIFYGSRTPDDMLYASELHQWRSHFDLMVDVTVDRSTGDWAGNVGVVPRLIRGGGFDPGNTMALLCGPEIMMTSAAETLEERGVDESRIYLSLERNMKCAVGYCGHCQLGPEFICKDGPVFRMDAVQALFAVEEF